MLLIFDIDDTLIDTSGTLIPPLLKNALTVLNQRGVVIGNFDKAYASLLHIDKVSISSEAALHEFIELHGGKKQDFDHALKEIYMPSELPKKVETLEGAVPLLQEIAKNFPLCIVSKGVEAIQKEKLQKAGIPLTLFDHILISENPQKKGQYLKILNRSGIPPEKILVIGDRISRDLTPAKELGMSTVHMKWGRGLGYTGIKTDVDYTITSLEELKDILEELSKEGYTHV